MIGRRAKVKIETERMTLRPPILADYRDWAELRAQSQEFLQPWEPAWQPDHLTRRSFSNRVYWAQKAVHKGTEVPLFLVRREDGAVLGGITLSNIRRGPAHAGTTGYWIGERYARNGYMREAVIAVVHYAFERLDLSRIEAGCLPENTPSRNLLESCGYKYEGVAQSYLQINGRWQNHVLYANLRSDRRGRAQ